MGNKYINPGVISFGQSKESEPRIKHPDYALRLRRQGVFDSTTEQDLPIIKQAEVAVIINIRVGIKAK